MGDVIIAQPWLPSSFLEMFSGWDTKKWKAWEFGSGFSTTWFAKRVHILWSMEHTPSWHKAVVKACERDGLKNVHLMLESLGGSYEAKITSLNDSFFDFVLVDGRNRVQCFKNSFPKTKKVIVLDNGLRDKYVEVRDMMASKSEWKLEIAEWADPVIRADKIVQPKDSWHALVWIRKGAKLK